MTALLKAALTAVAFGWRVLLVHALVDGRCTCGTDCGRNGGKHPRLTAWQRLATIDVVTITDWCRRWPTSNLGVATGAESNVVALDQDGDAGADSLRALEDEHGPLPETVINLTGRNGRHTLFLHPGGIVPNAVGLWPGIDIRGDGGQILIAPSRTVGPYAWEIGHEPGAVPLAPMPAWLLARLRQHDLGGTDRLRRDGMPLVLREGERNRRLFQLGALLRRYGLTAPAIGGCLRAINAEHARPPLAGDEVARIAASAARYRPEVTESRGTMDTEDAALARALGLMVCG